MKKESGKSVKVNKVLDISGEIEFEHLRADIARGKATTDYLAMMTGVDLPIEESEVIEENEQEI